MNRVVEFGVIGSLNVPGVRKEDRTTRQAHGMRMVSNIGIEWEAERQLARQRNQILVAILPRIDIPGG